MKLMHRAYNHPLNKEGQGRSSEASVWCHGHRIDAILSVLGPDPLMSWEGVAGRAGKQGELSSRADCRVRGRR